MSADEIYVMMNIDNYYTSTGCKLTNIYWKNNGETNFPSINVKNNPDILELQSSSFECHTANTRDVSAIFTIKWNENVLSNDKLKAYFDELCAKETTNTIQLKLSNVQSKIVGNQQAMVKIDARAQNSDEAGVSVDAVNRVLNNFRSNEIEKLQIENGDQFPITTSTLIPLTFTIPPIPIITQGTLNDDSNDSSHELDIFPGVKNFGTIEKISKPKIVKKGITINNNRQGATNHGISEFYEIRKGPVTNHGIFERLRVHEGPIHNKGIIEELYINKGPIYNNGIIEELHIFQGEIGNGTEIGLPPNTITNYGIIENLHVYKIKK